jgi:hypothetical protein
LNIILKSRVFSVAHRLKLFLHLTWIIVFLVSNQGLETICPGPMNALTTIIIEMQFIGKEMISYLIVEVFQDTSKNFLKEGNEKVRK